MTGFPEHRDGPNDGTTAIGFLLVPGFSMLCLVSAIEPLRVANQRSGRDLYSWHLFSADGHPVEASNAMTLLAEADIASMRRFPPVIVVCAGFDVGRHAGPCVAGWLRRAAVSGSTLGGLDTGPFLLAHAGLLKGHRVTLHWESLPAFRETWPDIDARETLFEIDRNRFTCSGGTAALDLMLHFIAMDQGDRLARAVSEQFIHDRIRAAQDHQRMAPDRRMGVQNDRLARIIELMQDNLEEPLSLDGLAQAAGLSKRQLSRMFQTHLSEPPQRHYLNLRLERAHQLLQQTKLPVFEIALACGFGSAPYFSRAYRARYGHPPVADRERT